MLGAPRSSRDTTGELFRDQDTTIRSRTLALNKPSTCVVLVFNSRMALLRSAKNGKSVSVQWVMESKARLSVNSPVPILKIRSG